MENIFNSPFFVKLQNFGQKLGSNKFLSALQAAMMSTMGVIMVGAISTIIASLGSQFGWFEVGSDIYNIIYAPYKFTMDMLSAWVVLLFAYNYAKKLDLESPILKAINAIIVFFLVAAPLSTNEAGTYFIDITYLSAQGMFVGFLIVFVVIQIEKFVVDRDIRIKMPDVVPQFLTDSLSSIIPLTIDVLIFSILGVVVSALTNGVHTVPSGFMALLSAPLAALTSVPGILILITFAAVLWIFGIHGTMIIVPVVMPLMFQAAQVNAAAYQAGEPLTFFPVAIFSAVSFVGGTGNTLPLVLMGLRSKSEQIRAVSKVALVPGWFNINEPVTFGMPIMYNPILAIPFVLNVPIMGILLYFGYMSGFLTMTVVPIFSLLPMGVAEFLTTLNWRNALWTYLMIIPVGLIYYPFFKAYEKQLVAKEQEAAQLEADAVV